MSKTGKNKILVFCRRNDYLLVFLLLTVMFLQSFLAGGGDITWGGTNRGDSLVIDELAHIAGGYGQLRYGDYRLNQEHPPLLKNLSSLPLLFLSDLKFPLDSAGWQSEPNGQWEVGRKFLYEMGNNTDLIILLSRLVPTFLIFLLGWYLFKWTKDLFGSLPALLAVFLFSFSPGLIAHSHYVTTDFAFATFAFIAVYYGSQFFVWPRRRNLLLWAAALALAFLTKFTALLLAPFWLLWFFLAPVFFSQKNKSYLRKSLKYLGAGIVLVLLVSGLVWLVYFFSTINMDEATLSRTLSEPFSGDHPAPVEWEPALQKLSRYPAGRPVAVYLSGLGILYRNDLNANNAAYSFGRYGDTGWKDYYGSAYLVKTPLPIILSLIFAVVVGLFCLSRLCKKRRNFTMAASTPDRKQRYIYLSVCLAISWVVLLWITGIFSRSNIGLRWMYPSYPFIFLLIAGAVAWFSQRLRRGTGKYWLSWVILSVLLIWLAVGTLLSYPFYLSYFNETIGASTNGYKYLIDSNLDWGQDLARLNAWLDQEGISEIHLDYFGGGHPDYYLSGKKIVTRSAGDPLPPAGSYLVVSATFYRVSDFYARGQYTGSYVRKLDREPDAQVGYSLLIYKINSEDLQNVD